MILFKGSQKLDFMRIYDSSIKYIVSKIWMNLKEKKE
jgi:hypothetical protein